MPVGSAHTRPTASALPITVLMTFMPLSVHARKGLDVLPVSPSTTPVGQDTPPSSLFGTLLGVDFQHFIPEPTLL
eukprot:2785233-Alexandrium_andersonii.AAC.1